MCVSFGFVALLCLESDLSSFSLAYYYELLGKLNCMQWHTVAFIVATIQKYQCVTPFKMMSVPLDSEIRRLLRSRYCS